MPEPEWSRSNRWLTVILITPDMFGADREQVRLALEDENIEARPVWPPARRAYASERSPCICSRYSVDQGPGPVRRSQEGVRSQRLGIRRRRSENGGQRSGIRVIFEPQRHPSEIVFDGTNVHFTG